MRRKKLWIAIIVAFGVLVVIIVVLAIFFSFFPVGLWISALASGVKIRISTLVGMRIRRITPSRLVYPLIKATKAGLDVSIDKMEAHYLAGGNIDRVINALIAAQRADIDLVFEQRGSHRPGGPRRAAGRADERQPQGH